ncbi:hypothetical protein ACFVP3_30395 [Streptomyces sp. NPDC057806]|uniref:hypothetical protein n=1 Tax=Streptomyces sp. NPDC057806 TaxID=3346255 RepID=UPI0036870BB3
MRCRATARWDNRDGKGAYVPSGTYTFKLTAAPADGSGPAMTVTQTVRVSYGAVVRRDFINYDTWVPDGIGDVMTLSPSGVRCSTPAPRAPHSARAGTSTTS